jgi:hydrogenase assembly chaperone HypC/HupF
MCLSIPGKVIEINGNNVVVRYKTEKRHAKTILNVKVGDYVIINGGLVIEIVPEKDALDSLKAVRCSK